MIILNIESATPVCSVALGHGDAVIALRETRLKNAHSAKLTLFVQEVMEEAGIPLTSLDAVAVSRGPGSYTGLRIGVAVAKGLCYSLQKPLIAIDTLQAMALGLKKSSGSYLCPMIDARRMEVYCAVFDPQLIRVTETEARIIDGNSFGDLLNQHPVTFGGEGSAKCKPLLQDRQNAIFDDTFHASARFMVPLSSGLFQQGNVVDPAYFEPFYLKEFIAGKPKVKGLF